VKIAGIKLRARILAPFKNSDRENKIGTLARARADAAAERGKKPFSCRSFGGL
jgi:hypothetical protein